MKIPAPLSAEYEIATSDDVRSWSFGSVTAPRNPKATFQDHIPGTLHDQRIFGPIRDFECACGKYAGARYTGMICDRCGVKIAPATVRGSRFAHVEFPEPVLHPFDPETQLHCFPILPILFAQSPSGSGLLKLYDQLIEAANRATSEKIEQSIGSILDFLTPVVITLHDWRIADAQTLARGLAIERKTVEDESEFCGHCGYVIAGLGAKICPACQSPLM
jgi:DNA-directed RNA polymerase beta' subunit